MQIAGLVARRIVVLRHARATRSSAGERFGLIRFGSRVDVYLPVTAQVLVGLGQTAVAGETVLADLKGEEAPRHFRRTDRRTKAAFRRRPPHSAGLPNTRLKIVSTCLK